MRAPAAAKRNKWLQVVGASIFVRTNCLGSAPWLIARVSVWCLSSSFSIIIFGANRNIALKKWNVIIFSDQYLPFQNVSIREQWAAPSEQIILLFIFFGMIWIWSRIWRRESKWLATGCKHWIIFIFYYFCRKLRASIIRLTPIIIIIIITLTTAFA